jgi:hypothetical protein
MNISLKRVGNWLVVGFVIWLVVNSSATSSDDISNYLGDVASWLGRAIERLGQFLSDLFGSGDSAPADGGATT